MASVDFLRVVAAATEQLERNPEAFPSTRDRFRRILLRRFPYGAALRAARRTSCVCVGLFAPPSQPGAVAW